MENNKSILEREEMEPRMAYPLYSTIPGYENYSVSTRGEVYSFARDRWLKPYKKPEDGRLSVLLNGKRMYVHQLVMLAFVGPCPEGMQVDHADGDCTNNYLGNLRYVTAKQNASNRKKSRKNAAYSFHDILIYFDQGMTNQQVVEATGLSYRQVTRLRKKAKSGG